LPLQPAAIRQLVDAVFVPAEDPEPANLTRLVAARRALEDWRCILPAHRRHDDGAAR
jgi:hypothetical protein